MPKLLVYAILSSSQPFAAKNLKHCSAGPIEILELGGVSVAVNHLQQDHRNPELKQSDWMAFGEVIAKLHALGDILPIRYGTILPLAELEHFVNQNKANHRAALSKVAGHSELNIRWLLDDDSIVKLPKETSLPNDKVSSGRDYLRRRGRQSKNERDLQAFATQLDNILSRSFKDYCSDWKTNVRCLPIHDTNGMKQSSISVAHANLLVPRIAWSQVKKIAEGVRIGEKMPILVSGPWAPYSFLEEVNTQVPVNASPRDLQKCAIQSPKDATS